MDIGDRIKELRKELKLTQQEFADTINIQRGAVASWEVKRTVPNTPSLSLICREFRVNRKWLEDGEGEMFNPVSREEEISSFIYPLLYDDGTDEFREFKLSLISTIAQMSADEWKAALSFLEKLNEEYKKRKG